MMTPMWSRWGSWAEWKAARFQKRSDMARCFYISRPNNPTKDTWPKLELKTTISIWGDEDSGERLSHQVVGLTPLSMLPHCAWLVRARRDSLCSDRYQCASLLYNFPLYTTPTNSSLTLTLVKYKRRLLFIILYKKWFLSLLARTSFREDSWVGGDSIKYCLHYC